MTVEEFISDLMLAIGDRASDGTVTWGALFDELKRVERWHNNDRNSL